MHRDIKHELNDRVQRAWDAFQEYRDRAALAEYKQARAEAIAAVEYASTQSTTARRAPVVEKESQ